MLFRITVLIHPSAHFDQSIGWTKLWALHTVHTLTPTQYTPPPQHKHMCNATTDSYCSNQDDNIISWRIRYLWRLWVSSPNTCCVLLTISFSLDVFHLKCISSVTNHCGCQGAHESLKQKFCFCRDAVLHFCTLKPQSALLHIVLYKH